MTTQGEIPPEGLVVFIEGPPRAIAEFDVNATNPRLPEEETEVTGPVIEGGSIVGTNETAGGLFFRITEENSSITVPVFQDDVAEGLETLTFTLRDGELYEVDANANSITVTIEDERPTTPEPTPEPTPTTTPEFGSLNADIIEVEGSDQIIFGGSESDLIDASIGSEGGNRIYAGSGDDTVILGTEDRIVGGSGDDKFFAMSGGDNIITGGAGADQFWIATAEIPEAANIITDFTSGEDVLGIAGLGIGFDDLSITAQGDNTLIAANGSDLAILQGIGADSLIADNFAFG
ncbi:MAG: calcium-binding protein [Cyanobacteria bacterium J06573_2]